MSDAGYFLSKSLQPFSTRAGGLSSRGSFGSKLMPEPSYEEKLAPYIADEYGKQAQSQKKMQPLRMLFDVLQRGQYLSANIVDEIIKSTKDDDPIGKDVLDVLYAAWQGITGERKGSYGQILKDQGIAQGKILPRREGKWGGNITWGDVLGFLGDIVLDPTTYISFGASKVALSVADDFAQDIARVTIQGLADNLPDLGKLASKGMNVQMFQKLMATNPDEGMKYASKFGNDVARVIEDAMRKAREKALTRPATELSQEMGEKLDTLENLFQDLAVKNEIPYDEYLAKLSGGERGLIDSLRGKAYTGAGTRSQRFFGKEFNVGQRDAWMPERAWRSLKGKFQSSRVGSKLGDAWWNVMNNGMVGSIRRDMGFRNPYQKYLRLLELQEGEAHLVSRLNKEVSKVYETVGDVDDAIMGKFVTLNDMAEQATKPGKPVLIGDLLNDKATRLRLQITDEEKVQIDGLTSRVRKFFSNEEAEYMQWMEKGYVPDRNSIINYLPNIYRDPNISFRRAAKNLGTSSPSYAKVRSYTREETAEQGISMMKWLFGVDDLTANVMVRDMGMAGFSSDLRELLATRAYAHSKLATRVNMLEKFKEFGVTTEMAEGALGKMLNRPNLTVQGLGLVDVNEKGLEGLLFDKEVATILQRVARATDPDNINVFTKAFRSFTGWWKGMVTMTTGFHARNHFSNQMTLFLKHGVRGMNPSDQQAALAGVVYAFRKGDPKKFLEGTGMDEGTWARLLNKRYGDKTVREIAEEARTRGLVSEATHGFDPKTALDKMVDDKKSLNPMSSRFIGRDISYKVGSYVENTPKMTSILLDYDDIMKGAAEGTNPVAAMDWAVKEAKKWWIDYTDLTEFEKTTLKNVIPFYTWLRHNIGNQLSSLVNYPDMFAVFPKLEDALTYDDPDFDPDAIPPWMKQLGMFPMFKTNEGDFAMFNPNFPYQDINKIPLLFEEGNFMPSFSGQEVKDDLINSMHPWVKSAMQVMTEKGYDFFYKQDLADTRKAPYLFRLFASNPAVLGMLDGIAGMAGKTLKAHVDDRGKLVMDGKLSKLLEDNLPILRMIEYGLYLPQTIIPGLEEGIEKLTMAKGEYEGWEQFFQVLSYYAGVKFKPLDVQAEKERIARETYFNAVDVYNRDAKTSPDSQARSLRSKEQLSARIGRLTDGYR